MSNAPVVRRLRASDADLACQIIHDMKWEEESADTMSMDAARLKLWLENPANVLIAAHSLDDIGVGFALGYLLDRIDQSRPMLCFYEIVVSSDHHRRGIGRQLVEAMKSVAHQSNAAKMWVQTSPDNQAARTLYQRAGGIENTDPDHVYSWSEETFGNKQASLD